MAHADLIGLARLHQSVEQPEQVLDMQRHSDNMAAREAEVRDHALDAIDEAITMFRAESTTSPRLGAGATRRL